MKTLEHSVLLRVRYSETDQMGTFYNSRALEWFEVGRTEWLRHSGVSYAQCESLGLLLPLVEAHVRYQGRARYDDLLRVTMRAKMESKASVKFMASVVHEGTQSPVADGWTIHAVVSAEGKPMRPPAWFTELFQHG